MIKTIHICDNCGRNFKNSSEIYRLDFRTSKFIDAAGDLDDNVICVELCEDCATQAVKALKNIAEKTK